MKWLFSILFLLASNAVPAQQGQFQINLKLDETKSQYFDPRYKADVIEAFRLANLIFNSDEFQKEIATITLDYNSYCKWNRHDGRSGRISGEEILSRLFRGQHVVLAINLQKSGSALGETTDSSYLTTAWYDNIVADMDEFPFSYGLAVNLCHEYMHQVGFCHLYCTQIWPLCPGNRKLREPKGGKEPDPKFFDKDVTYRVGWSAYYLLKKWKEEGKL